MGHRARICEQLAQRLDAQVEGISLSSFPKVPSCDCLILDRTMDAVAPIIHEWTYEAMAYDLLPVENNVYNRPGGTVGTTEVLLDEQDNLWKELRHMHIAEASTAVNDKIDAFKKANAAARIKVRGLCFWLLIEIPGCCWDGHDDTGHEDTHSVASRIQVPLRIAWQPESAVGNRDVLSNMSLHIDISRDLFQVTNDRHLKEIGELEQDLVYGEKHSKDIIALLSNDLNLNGEDKVQMQLH